MIGTVTCVREYGILFFQSFEFELHLDVIKGRRIETSSDREAYGVKKCIIINGLVGLNGEIDKCDNT